MEDLVMRGTPELVVEACNLIFLPAVHPWHPHPLLCFLDHGLFLASCLPSYSHVIARMIVAACMKKMLTEAKTRGTQAALAIQNWCLHLMASLVDMDPKGMVLGAASLGNLENVETETADVKENGKGNIHSQNQGSF